MAGAPHAYGEVIHAAGYRTTLSDDSLRKYDSDAYGRQQCGTGSTPRELSRRLAGGVGYLKAPSVPT